MDHWPWKAPRNDHRSQVCPMLTAWVMRQGKARQIRARRYGNCVCVLLRNSWRGSSCAQKLSAQLPCKLWTCVLKWAWANTTTEHQPGAQNCSRSSACGPELFYFKNQGSVPRRCWTLATDGLRVVRISQPWISGEKDGLEEKQTRQVLVRCWRTEARSCDRDAWVLPCSLPSGQAKHGKGRRASQRYMAPSLIPLATWDNSRFFVTPWGSKWITETHWTCWGSPPF